MYSFIIGAHAFTHKSPPAEAGGFVFRCARGLEEGPKPENVVMVVRRLLPPLNFFLSTEREMGAGGGGVSSHSNVGRCEKTLGVVLKKRHVSAVRSDIFGVAISWFGG